MDDETIQAMQGIADAGAGCVEQSGSSSPASLRSEYHRLRDDAAALNQRFGWASQEEFTSRKQIAAMSVTGRPFDVRSTVGVGGHPS
jgi:hypothetical protein